MGNSNSLYENSQELENFKASVEHAKQFIDIGSGPNGRYNGQSDSASDAQARH